MSRLNSFFDEEERPSSHPVLQYLDTSKPEIVQVEIRRPEDVLGYKPAKLFLIVTVRGVAQPPQEYAWDDALNEALIRRGVKAVSSENEKLRFALTLKAEFKPIIDRFDDGYFNCVIVDLIKSGDLMNFQEISGVMIDVFANPAARIGHSYEDCSDMIQNVLRRWAKVLMATLCYERLVAEEILAGAVARYMNERFTVSDRRKLGWTQS